MHLLTQQLRLGGYATLLIQELQNAVEWDSAVLLESNLAGFAGGIARATTLGLIGQRTQGRGIELGVGEAAVAAETTAGDFLGDGDFATTRLGDTEQGIRFLCLFLAADGVDQDWLFAWPNGKAVQSFRKERRRVKDLEGRFLKPLDGKIGAG